MLINVCQTAKKESRLSAQHVRPKKKNGENGWEREGEREGEARKKWSEKK